jgi:hypothetical protein
VKLIRVTLALLSLTLFGCRLINPEPEEEAASAAAVKSTESAPANSCAKAPAMPVCCEAMTPACNDCREKNAQTMDAWRAACLKPEAIAPDCATAPVTSCPNDGTDAARDCRQQALNVMMAWKEKCGAEETPASCDKKPSLTVCCQAMIPSCEACRARNDRSVAEWQRRCAK